MPELHALISPSSSHRWLECPPSVRMSEKFENRSSIAAKEGTAAHEKGEWKLRKFNREKVGPYPLSEFDSEEMEICTDGYEAFVIEMLHEAVKEHGGTYLYVERQVHFDNWIPEGFGTADAVLVSDDFFHVIDFKYGKGVLVEAKDNPQMKIYALGVIQEFGESYDFKTIKMSIYQPRINNVGTFEMSVDELLDWAEHKVRPAAALAFEGKGELKTGEHCRFCLASPKCPAWAEAFSDIHKFSVIEPNLMSDEEINELLPKLAPTIAWANSVIEYAEKEALAGKKWAGFKLVEGRSNRKYSDEGKVVAACKEAGYTDIYKRTLLSITDMEKLMGKKAFAETLGNLIVKPAGKLNLVPESDKRMAVDVSPADKFNEIEGE